MWAQGRGKKITHEGRDWVEDVSGSVPVAGRVQVQVHAVGVIEVRGGSEGEIAYHVRKRLQGGSEEAARRKLAAYNLRTRRSGETVEFSMEPEGGNKMGADFFLTVPRTTARAHLQTRGGNVLVDGIEGEALASTAGGNIHADHIGRGVRLETAGGNLIMGRVGGTVDAETAGGGITLESAGGEVLLVTHGGSITADSCEKGIRARTAGGNIRILRTGGDVQAETAGGAIHLGDAGGKVIAQTAGGGIEVGSARGLVRAESQGGGIRLWKVIGPVRAETAAGSIIAQLMADSRSWAESQLETSGGDVTVYLPMNLAITILANVEMASRNHAIRSDFPVVLHKGGDAAGLQEIFGEIRLNGGGAPLRIRTTAGNIEIRKAK